MESFNNIGIVTEALFNEVADDEVVLDAVHEGITKVFEDIFLTRLFVFLLGFVFLNSFLGIHSATGIFQGFLLATTGSGLLFLDGIVLVAIIVLAARVALFFSSRGVASTSVLAAIIVVLTFRLF